MKKKKPGRPRTRIDPTAKFEVGTSADADQICIILAQKRDDAMIESNLVEEEEDFRRRRSLKFRKKMRDRRSKLFDDPFFRPDRSVKNSNKVAAAKRRKRDDAGKFNFEEQKVEYE